jgi:murein DD-endopeptidase MepM/ murein hydrolase activator NlpD
MVNFLPDTPAPSYPINTPDWANPPTGEVTQPGTSPTAPVEGEAYPLPGDTNLRRQDGAYLKFNAAIPTQLHSQSLYKGRVPYGNGAKPIYREAGFNERGMIVRDFNMNERLKAADSGWASTSGRWGFQFHYNPSEIQESFTAPMDIAYADFIRDIAANPLLLMSCNTGATITVKLLLSRAEDMRVLLRDDWQQQYPLLDRPTEEDRAEILARGTQYDIEYLFRVINLDPVNTWREETSDWGMLMATPVIMSVGDSEGCRKYRGIVASMSVQHQQYAPGMIPVYSFLSINFLRTTDMYGLAGYTTVGAGSDSAVAGNIPGDPNSGPQGTGAGQVQGPGVVRQNWAMPTKSDWLVYLGFKTRGATNYALGAHTGIDIWAPKNADSSGGLLYAVDDGTIAAIHQGGALGTELVLKTKAGPYACYGHMQGVASGIKVGMSVTKGRHIGFVGKSGMSSGAAAHLHFEVRNEVAWRKSWSVFQDPAMWLLNKSSQGWTNKSPHALRR